MLASGNTLWYSPAVSWPNIVDRLVNGDPVTIRPSGSSMAPRILSKQEVTIFPVGESSVEVGMVVLAKVKGRFYLHLVSAIDGRRVQISNNHGFVNGWTTLDRVFGVVR